LAGDRRSSEEVRSPDSAKKQYQKDLIHPSGGNLQLKVHPPTEAALFKPSLEVMFTWPKVIWTQVSVQPSRQPVPRDGHHEITPPASQKSMVSGSLLLVQPDAQAGKQGCHPCPVVCS